MQKRNLVRPQYFVFWGSDLERASAEEHIRYTLRAAILTRLGERTAAPKIGSRVTDFLFRPLSPAIKSEMAAAVREAVETAEPRVEIRSIDVAMDQSMAAQSTGVGRILILITYLVKATNRSDQLKLHL